MAKNSRNILNIENLRLSKQGRHQPILRIDDLILKDDTFTVVMGPNGAGKSTLVNELLHPALSHSLGLKVPFPKGVKELKGIKAIDKVIVIDQSPIGRTPRSNPATYTGAFGPIRDWFTSLPSSFTFITLNINVR